jgi:hypothetical protein
VLSQVSKATRHFEVLTFTLRHPRRSGPIGKGFLAATFLGAASMAVMAAPHGYPAEANASSTSERCAALTKIDWAGIEITSAKVVPAAPPGTVPLPGPTNNMIPSSMPEYCRVAGVINHRKGAGGVGYGIGFELALPTSWSGQLLFQGGGGYDGSVHAPYGWIAAGDVPALARGFAVVTMDGGHNSADAFDTSFKKDQQSALDFAFNAVPTVTRLSKKLVAAYFGRGPHHTYSDGCSTGGREGMLAAERYPSLFDGIIAGDPAMRTANTRIAGWNATVAFNRIAPRDARGNPLRLQGFPLPDQKLLHDAVANQCDGLDGLKDGLILDLAVCKFDPVVLQCKGEKTAACLSAKEVAALKMAFGGPKDSQGNPLYTSFPYDLGLLGEHPDSPAHILPAAVPGIYDTPPSPFAVDFGAELARMRSDPMQILSDTFYWTDLGTFYRRGGKIIFYNGASDPWFSLFDTVDYFNRSKQANPEFDSSRLFSIPGMSHCGGGGLERFDMLTAIVDWVEHGVAPDRILATDWERRVSRPLCPWPRYARYRGVGNPNNPTSFECRSD